MSVENAEIRLLANYSAVRSNEHRIITLIDRQRDRVDVEFGIWHNEKMFNLGRESKDKLFFPCYEGMYEGYWANVPDNKAVIEALDAKIEAEFNLTALGMTWQSYQIDNVKKLIHVVCTPDGNLTRPRTQTISEPEFSQIMEAEENIWLKQAFGGLLWQFAATQDDDFKAMIIPDWVKPE